jgi:DNA processing protein
MWFFGQSMRVVDALSSVLPLGRGLPAAWVEMGAYEALWLQPGASFKSVAERIAATASGNASDLIASDLASECADKLRHRFAKAKLSDIGMRFFGEVEYPSELGDACYPLRAFYFRGDWSLLSGSLVAEIGARQIT